MIGERLHVNRQKTIEHIILTPRHHPNAKKPPEGGSQPADNVVTLKGYRRKSSGAKDAIQNRDDRVLLLLRHLAPGVDDGRLARVLDRVASAWAIACAASGAFDGIV